MHSAGKLVKADRSEEYRIECKRVFQSYYARLAQSLPVEEILPDLVSNDLITIEEMQDILTEKKSSTKARSLLMGPLWRSINGGYPDTFIKVLCIMQRLPNEACTALSREICVKLNITNEMAADVLSE